MRTRYLCLRLSGTPQSPLAVLIPGAVSGMLEIPCLTTQMQRMGSSPSRLLGMQFGFIAKSGPTMILYGKMQPW